jgi:hypothetical protein
VGNDPEFARTEVCFWHQTDRLWFSRRCPPFGVKPTWQIYEFTI